jgi:uncharacterized protein (TIGR00661 family)
MITKKQILVAPLNWGLGHATRCIPIINALIENNYQPLLASNGIALQLLKKEFPELICIELPSYNIKYSKNGKSLKWKLLIKGPKIIKAILAEKKALKIILKTYKVDGIISDNRFGVLSKKVPSVFITHQLNVLSGNTTWISTYIQQKFIKRFDECWVPDVESKPNLTGKLGHLKNNKLPVKYINPLSRFNNFNSKIIYNVLVLLSGPEPQRSILEVQLLSQLETFKGKVLFVKGLIGNEQTIIKKKNIIIYNFMLSHELEKAINESAIVLSRSGYTTIMDLAKLNKKAFFIPTPGQFEQEYLAQRLEKLHLIPSCKQADFKIEMLNMASNYKGLHSNNFDINFKALFSLFERE